MYVRLALRHFDKNDLLVLQEHVLVERSCDEIYTTIDEWNTCCYNGKHFEMFAVCMEQTIIGTISLYQHTEDTISIGPEIFREYQQKGYASIAMTQALAYAKGLGYTCSIAQIRKNNIASIRLHEKVGFVFENQTINRRGKEVLIYTKML